MKKILVLYYSMYGHIETLAGAVAEGAASVPGVTVDIRRVPELMSAELAQNVGAKLDQPAEVIRHTQELANYDGIIFGTPTRFGNMCAQMRNFLDQTGGLWIKGALVGKVGSVFTSTGTGGGAETTITSTWNTLAHHGMAILGLPYEAPEMFDISQPRGGSPYGAATLAGGDGKRQPSEKELILARAQGRHVAAFVARLAEG